MSWNDGDDKDDVLEVSNAEEVGNYTYLLEYNDEGLPN